MKTEPPSPALGRTLTADERAALSAAVNLADAHTYQSMTPTEEAGILARFPELFAQSIRRDYWELERDAAWSFGTSLGQSPSANFALASYASSISTMIVARAIRRLSLPLSLTVPTFDNVHDLLKGEGLSVTPRPLAYPLNDWIIRHNERHVFYEVSPNNPTGHYITEDELRRVARSCEAGGHVLVLDQSFKAHDARACFDYYSILESAGASYAIIEDTGKLWPIRDLKVSFLHASANLRPLVRDVADDVLLNVAPFILALTDAYADYSKARGYGNVRDVLERNRDLVRNFASESSFGVEIPYPDSRVSVEVLELQSERDFVKDLSKRGLHILNCAKFYWGGETPSKTQLRLALARNDEVVRAGIRILGDYLRSGAQ